MKSLEITDSFDSLGRTSLSQWICSLSNDLCGFPPFDVKTEADSVSETLCFFSVHQYVGNPVISTALKIKTSDSAWEILESKLQQETLILLFEA